MFHFTFLKFISPHIITLIRYSLEWFHAAHQTCTIIRAYLKASNKLKRNPLVHFYSYTNVVDLKHTRIQIKHNFELHSLTTCRKSICVCTRCCQNCHCKRSLCRSSLESSRVQLSHYHCMFRDLKSFAHAKKIFSSGNVQIKRKLSDITDALEYKMRKNLFLEWILWSVGIFSSF